MSAPQTGSKVKVKVINPNHSKVQHDRLCPCHLFLQFPQSFWELDPNLSSCLLASGSSATKDFLLLPHVGQRTQHYKWITLHHKAESLWFPLLIAVPNNKKEKVLPLPTCQSKKRQQAKTNILTQWKVKCLIWPDSTQRELYLFTEQRNNLFSIWNKLMK